MKKQIIAWMVLAVLATTWAYTYATNSSTGSVTKNEIMDIVKKARDWVILTTDEQTKLDAVKSKKYSKTWSGETMFNSGKHRWFGMKGWKDNFSMMWEWFSKMTENKAKAEAKETVIDKLLAGTALNADEEVIRTEMIKERAKMKARKVEMETKMIEIKTIMEKKKSWAELSSEEQAKIDAMKKEHKKWWKWEKRGMEGMMR